jgi:maleylpyruvate isomerase
MIVLSRLGEVLIHHVDLGTGFGAGSWPEAFVREMLGVAVRSLGERTPGPMAVRLRAVDTGRDFQIGDPAGSLQVSGAEPELLAWLLGRSDGAGLGRDTPGPLPPLPSVYFT